VNALGFDALRGAARQLRPPLWYEPRVMGRDRNLAPLTWLPKAALGVLYEVGRHLLKRPVVGITAVARTEDGRILLVRRGDTGTWALPGGTLEWGEELADAIPREVEEETGARWVDLDGVSGIYSRPDRDPRFHAVTVCVRARVAEPIRGPKNLLEIREARLFAPDELPDDLAMGNHDMLDDALSGADVVLE
jgi:8-oxo-dGTP diphosphatase